MSQSHFGKGRDEELVECARSCRNVAQMLQAKGETIHRVTMAPTSDPSTSNAEQPTETLLLNEKTSTPV